MSFSLSRYCCLLLLSWLSVAADAADVLTFTPSDRVLLVNQSHDFSLHWSQAGVPQAAQVINAFASHGTVIPQVLTTDAQGSAGFSLSATQAGTATLRLSLNLLGFQNLEGLQTLDVLYVDSLDSIAHLDVSLAGSGGGSVRSGSGGLLGDGIDCGSICNETFTLNESISLTAVPDAVSRFLGWAGDCSGTETLLSVALNTHKSCSAIFEKITGNPIDTLAGTGSSGFGGDGGAALAAQLRVPAGLCIDSAGTIFFADAGNHRLRSIDLQGVISTVAGNGSSGFEGDGGPASLASLNYPTDVAVDSSGNLYIADSLNHRIRKIASDGSISTFAGTGDAGFGGDDAAARSALLNRPTSVAIDAGDNLYVADNRNHRIRKINGGGIISTVAGIGTPGFGGDGGLAVNALLLSPTAVAVDGAGFVYLVDQGNQRVRFISPQGVIATLAGNGMAGFAGDGGAGPLAQLNNPLDVVVDGGGQVYISDSFNHRIRRVANGVIETLAGTGKSGYSGDGAAALLADLGQPWGLAVNADGQVIFSGVVNHVLRRVDTTVQSTPPPIIPPDSDTVALEISLTGDGSGTINAPAGQGSGIDCGSQCRELYDKETQLQLTANASVDSSFVSWGGDCLGTDNPLRLTLEVSKSCTAEFASLQNSPFRTLRITLSGSGQGAVWLTTEQAQASQCDSHCTETFDTGSSVLLSASAADDSEFIGWRGDCGGSLTPLTLSMNRSYHCEAVFERLPASVALGVIDTVAGNGAADFAGDGGAATAAALKFPSGLGFDANRRLLIVDTLNNRIRAVEQGVISSVQTQLASPSSMTISREGVWFIADTLNHRVRRVAVDGFISTVAGSGLPGSSGDNAPALQARLASPQAVAVDAAGHLLIADSNNHRIRRVDSSGRISTFAGTGVAGFSGDGDFATLAQLHSPAGLLLTPSGELLIADSGNQRIRQVDHFGKITTLVGSGESGFAQGGFAGDGGVALAARLNNPRGLSLDDEGNLYIADSNNHRVRKVTPQGLISTLAGIGQAGFSGDGASPALAALNNPNDVKFDSNGILYIADSGNHRIRRIAAAHPLLIINKDGDGNGSVTAVAGVDDGIDCGNNCREAYLPGTRVLLQAIADNASRVSAWQGCTPLPDNPEQVNLLMQSDRTCTVTFSTVVVDDSCPSSGVIDTDCTAVGLTLTGVNITPSGNVKFGTLAGTSNSQGSVSNVQFAAGAALHGGQISGQIIGQADGPALLTHVRIQAGSRLSQVILGANVIVSDDVSISPLRYLNKDVVPLDNDGPQDFTPLWNTIPPFCTEVAQPVTLDVRGEIYADRQSLLAAINQIASFSDANLRFTQDPDYGFLVRDNNNQRLLLRPISVKHSSANQGSFAQDNHYNARFITNNGLDLQAQPALQGLCDFAQLLRDSGLQDLAVDERGNLRQPLDDVALAYVRPSAYLKRLGEAVEGLDVKADESNGLETLIWKYRRSDTVAVYEQVLYPAAFQLDGLLALASDVLRFSPNGEVLFDDGQVQFRWRFDYLVTRAENPSGEWGFAFGERAEDLMITYPSGEQQLLIGLP